MVRHRVTDSVSKGEGTSVYFISAIYSLTDLNYCYGTDLQELSVTRIDGESRITNIIS